MKFFVGVTDNNWFSFLAAKGPDEVNFWRPGSTAFKVLEPGDLFLFKLHSPLNYIAGGGYFVKYTRLPLSLAWLAFGEKNGFDQELHFRRAIQSYRNDSMVDPEIGCIVLTQPFFFPRELWVAAPADWPRSAVQGKGYDTEESETGRHLYEEVQRRIAELPDQGSLLQQRPPYGPSPTQPEGERYRERLARMRLGQGGFRVLVLDAYERRCAITGEKTLPVLEAAHILPYEESGPHSVNNGILMRADMHILFDRFYLTVTPERRILVSKNIHEQFTNGRLYYSYQDQPLRSLPGDPAKQPGRAYLERHNEQFFKAQAAS